MALVQRHVSPSATRAAKRVFRKLGGTLVRDLRSMIKWASEFDSIPDKSPDLGALNFALMLVALIGCEALGFWRTPASPGGRRRMPAPARSRHLSDAGHPTPLAKREHLQAPGQGLGR